MNANIKKGKLWVNEQGKEHKIVKVFGAYSTVDNMITDTVTRFVILRPKGSMWSDQYTIDELLENFKPKES